MNYQKSMTKLLALFFLLPSFSFAQNTAHFKPIFSTQTPALKEDNGASERASSASGSPEKTMMTGGAEFFETVKSRVEELYQHKSTNNNLWERRDLDFLGEMVMVTTYKRPLEFEYTLVAPSGEEFKGFAIRSFVYVENENKKPKLFSVSLQPLGVGFGGEYRHVELTYWDKHKINFDDVGSQVSIVEESINTFALTTQTNPSNLGNDMINVEDFKKLIKEYKEKKSRTNEVIEQDNNAEPSGLSPVPELSSSSSIVENTYTVSTLFLLDRNLFASKGYNNIRLELRSGLEFARTLMYQHGNGMATPYGGKWGIGVAYFKDHRGWNIFGYEPAPASLCTSLEPCDSDYTSLLVRMATDTQVEQLRKKYNADLVMYVHNTAGISNGRLTDGTAIRTLDIFAPDSEAPIKVAVYNFHKGKKTFVHELFHLLGAGHSKYFNNAPSSHPSEAYIGLERYYSSVYGETVTHPYKTFMAYESTCNGLASLPQLKCRSFETLSTSNEFHKHDGEIYNIGGSFTDNYWAMYRMMPRSASWSHYYNKP